MRRDRTWLASAVTLAAWAIAAPSAAQVTAPNGDIAFTVCDYVVGERVCDIWLMRPDGSDPTNLTDTPEINEFEPAWSPDGTRIAYSEGSNFLYKIRVMNADGSGQADVVATPSYQFGPSWSPDGLQMAFTRQVPGVSITDQFDILVVDVEGTGETNLTESDYDELGAAWAPDGSRIAFAAVRPEWRAEDQDFFSQWEIVTVDPDGSDEQILTAGAVGTPRGDFLDEDRAPAWSPDSRMLVYMTQNVDPCCPPWQIEKIDRDGTDLVLLSDNPAFNDVFPSFSPDGTLIIFMSDRDGELAFYTMPAPAPEAAVHTPAAVTPLPAPANASDPVWGPAPRLFEPRGLQVDVHGSGSGSDLNGVFEPGESAIVEPAWHDGRIVALPFTGTASAFTGPAGPVYVIEDLQADYGTAGVDGLSDCYGATPSHDCYAMRVTGDRPATHWDATFDETLVSGPAEFVRTWTLHVGGSFSDVPASQPFYPFIETLFHNGVTGGCDADAYCPETPVTRGQMAVFLLKSKHGTGHEPAACAGVFDDVPCPSPFADWIEELFQDGITGGCGAGIYCPEAAVTRAQMAVFLLKTAGGSAYAPPPCTGAVFTDVPCTGGAFDPWIEDLASRGISGGCGNGSYCPAHPNNRGQMAVFLVKTFGLELSGP